MKRVGAYDLIEEREVPEHRSVARIYRHTKTKAKVVAISNDDINKVFAIGFRTTPTDDTGVAHIMEHSVLCGSDKFPVKDPFVELAKGSLNTFLNAMTYPDKTVYPVASYNDKDFRNLMDVYLDAVFHPNVYKEEKIMRQEGWRYELENAEDDLAINGVVYNEMKGVYSDPEQMLDRYIMKSLLPSTTYGCESGGDPVSIPDLTYEQFLDFHRKYYHPTNSYIYLYGDMDMDETLAYIDREYLAEYDFQPVDSKVSMEIGFDKPVKEVVPYALSEDDELTDNTFLSYNFCIGTSLDSDLNRCMKILSNYLFSVPGAPVKEALIKAGIGADVDASYDDSIQQPILSIVAYNANEEDADRFVSIIDETIKKVVKEGIPKKSLQALINAMEFSVREADYGRYPKGLMYGLSLFNSWLYNEKAALEYFPYEEGIEFMKRGVENGYFERQLEAYLVNNVHKSVVILKPEHGLQQKADRELKEKLATYKATLSKEQIAKIIADTKELKEYQATPSSEEDLKKIPLLNREDLNPLIRPARNEVKDHMGIPVVVHDYATNGIAYVDLCFKMEHLPYHLYPYASLLAAVLGMMSTEKYSYRDLADEVLLKTGGITTTFTVRSGNTPEECLPTFDIRMKMLYSQIEDGFRLMEEMLLHTRLEDTERLHEILAEIRSGMKQSLSAKGHTTAAKRAVSYVTKQAALNQLISGIDYYEFIERADKDFDACKEDLVAGFKEVIEEILHKENLIVSYTADNDMEQAIGMNLTLFSVYLTGRREESLPGPVELKVRNEAFKTAGQVQYVATGGDFKKAGFVYHGALDVLETIFSYDYLWNQVRVQGGAYGAMCTFGDNGASSLVSYRDPNLKETFEIFKGAAEYVRNFDCDERDMTKYVIGSINEYDAPRSASEYGDMDFRRYLRGRSDADLQKEKDELLATDCETIRSFADLVASVTSGDIICCVGNGDKVEEQAELFKEIRSVF